MERTELFVCKCFDVRHQLVLRVLETKENEEHIVYGSFHLVHIPFWDKLKCAIKYLFGIKRKDGDFDAMLFCPEDADRLEWFAKYLDAGLSVTDRDTNPIHFKAGTTCMTWLLRRVKVLSAMGASRHIRSYLFVCL